MHCRHSAFEICKLIAQTDQGRRSLLEHGILPVLVQLSADGSGINVIGACEVLSALAQSEAFKAEMIAAGVRTAMERITRYAIMLNEPTSYMTSS
jgi:hypothetical protein